MPIQSSSSSSSSSSPSSSSSSSSSSSADQAAKFEANRPGSQIPIIDPPRFDSETSSHCNFCVRTGKGCFGQKSRCPVSIGKSPNTFGAAALPLKLLRRRLKLNPVLPQFTGKNRSQDKVKTMIQKRVRRES